MLPVHNRGTYLKEAITSVVTQSLADFELIIVDDASHDPGVREIVSDAECGDDRIRVIRHQKNRGVSVARNTGIAEARAPLIAFMDDDDVSRSNRLQIQREYLSRHPEVMAVAASVTNITGHGKRRWFAQAPAINKISSQDLSQGLPFGLARDLTMDATSMVRRDALLEVGGYREWFRRAEDMDLTFRVMERMPIARIADRLYLRRLHQDPSRASLLSDGWDYYASSVFSMSCRLKGVADPVEEGFGLPEILSRLCELDGYARKHLIWASRGLMRRQIRVDGLEDFVRIREKVRVLVQDDDDRKVFAKLLRRALLWGVLYRRSWSRKEAR